MGYSPKALLCLDNLSRQESPPVPEFKVLLLWYVFWSPTLRCTQGFIEMQEPKLKMHREASNAWSVPGGRGRQVPGIHQTATPGARRTPPFSLHLLSFTCYTWCPKKDSGQPAGNWCSTSDWKHQILRQKSSRLEFLLSCNEKDDQTPSFLLHHHSEASHLPRQRRLTNRD